MKTLHFRSYSNCFKQDTFAVTSETTPANYFVEYGLLQTIINGLSHPQWLCAIFLVLFFSLGIYFRIALILALCLSFLLVLNYFYLRAIAENLHLKLDHVSAVTEKESARFNFSMANFSFFTINNLFILFEFTGSTNSTYKRRLAYELSADSNTRIGFDLICNMGMGIYEVHNFRVIVSDPWDIFQFLVAFDNKTEVEVRPKIEVLPKIKTRGSKYSEMYGLEEIQSRGISVNFSNLRPYTFGDSIRHVAWRPSARHGNLIVKEFERMVNTEATIILNLNPTQHIGLAELNTWETAKDVCLSVVSQMLANGNSVEFIYNYGIIEKSNSKEQFYAISRELLQHDIISAANGEHNNKVHIDDPFAHWSKRIEAGSTLFYISAVNYQQLRDSSSSLKWLSRENVEVILILINPLTIWPEFRAVESSIEAPNKTDQINKLLLELQTNQVRVFFADMGGSLNQNFREKPYLSEKLSPVVFKNLKGEKA